MTQTLPPVATKIYVHCKKCNAERYHTVLAHTTSQSAKVECEVCKKKSTYSIKPKAAKKSSGKTSGKGPASQTQWAEMLAKVKDDTRKPYNMKQKFDLDTTIQHPKFGVGVITAVNAEQIQVMFELGQKALVHNRTS